MASWKRLLNKHTSLLIVEAGNSSLLLYVYLILFWFNATRLLSGHILGERLYEMWKQSTTFYLCLP